MMGAEVEVQRALFQALTTAGLTVCDFASQITGADPSTGYPFVEVGTIIFTEWDTYTDNGHYFLARIRTFSRSSSALETKTIQGQIYTALHRKPLTITGQNCPLVMREMSDVLRLSDGSFQGTCEYRGLIQAT